MCKNANQALPQKHQPTTFTSRRTVAKTEVAGPRWKSCQRDRRHLRIQMKVRPLTVNFSPCRVYRKMEHSCRIAETELVKSPRFSVLAKQSRVLSYWYLVRLDPFDIEKKALVDSKKSPLDDDFIRGPFRFLGRGSLFQLDTRYRAYLIIDSRKVNNTQWSIKRRRNLSCHPKVITYVSPTWVSFCACENR